MVFLLKTGYEHNKNAFYHLPETSYQTKFDQTQHLHICCMNFVIMHNFMQSHKIVAKMTENCKTTENLDSDATEIVTLMSQNCVHMLKRLREYF